MRRDVRIHVDFDNTLVLFPGHTFRQVVRHILLRLDGEVVIIFAYGREGLSFDSGSGRKLLGASGVY